MKRFTLSRKRRLYNSKMSKKKQIIELEPPGYDDMTEISQFADFACPKCNGSGKLRDWDARRDEKAYYECPRCGGSGRLQAKVQIVWSAQEKENE